MKVNKHVWMPILAKKSKTPLNTQKKQQPTENQKNRLLNIRMSAKGGPVLHLAWKGASHCIRENSHWNLACLCWTNTNVMVKLTFGLYFLKR